MNTGGLQAGTYDVGVKIGDVFDNLSEEVHTTFTLKELEEYIEYEKNL